MYIEAYKKLLELPAVKPLAVSPGTCEGILSTHTPQPNSAVAACHVPATLVGSRMLRATTRGQTGSVFAELCFPDDLSGAPSWLLLSQHCVVEK